MPAATTPPDTGPNRVGWLVVAGVILLVVAIAAGLWIHFHGA
jgi:LPXTG-motif cell wall-anchored protein